MAKNANLTLFRYYRSTWFAVLSALTFLVVTSQVVPPWIILSLGSFSALIVSIPAHRIASSMRLIRLSIGLLLTMLFAYEVSNYTNFAHGIRIMIEMIIGALPLTLATFQKNALMDFPS